MFTGIVAGRGRVVARRSAGGGAVLEIEAGFALDDPREGESIAVDGVCLTAYRIHGRTFQADLSPETLGRTKLGRLGSGAVVNLERALLPTDRLGGHIVTGHIDCLATVVTRQEQGGYTLFTFTLPERYGRYLIEKGSVAVDGVSLTVNSVAGDRFTVSIIPHSLAATTLSTRQSGDVVNIEVDIVGKYIEKLLSPRLAGDERVKREGVDFGFLASHGYL